MHVEEETESMWPEATQPTMLQSVASSIHWKDWLPGLAGLSSAIGAYRTDWKDALSGDIAAGLVVAVMLIPQALAYALLAGMPAVTGFFSAILALFVYPLGGGSSCYQAVGPVALMSLLSHAAVTSAIHAEGLSSSTGPVTARFAELSAKLAFLIGAAQVAMGLLRAGYLINFLSHSVLAAFTASSAIIIASSQLAKAFGLATPQSEYVWQIWRDVAVRLPNTHALSFGLFVANMIAFVVLNDARARALKSTTVTSRPWLKAIVRVVSVALIVVTVNILVVGGARLDLRGVKVLGSIPAGMPPFRPENVFGPTLSRDAAILLPSAALIALISYVESASVAKSMESKYGVTRGGKPVDGNQEFLGLGLANVVVSVFSGFPITGGFARSGVNAEAGARTVIAGIVSGSLLCIIVSFATGIFHYLPDVALAALIVYSAWRLMEARTIQYLMVVDKTDALVYAATFACTLGAGIETGLVVGAGLSLLRIVREAAQPHSAVLGRMPDGVTYRNVARFPNMAVPVPGIVIVRLDGPLFFANVDLFKDRVLAAAFQSGAHKSAESTRPSAQPAQDVVQAVILDLCGVPSVDSAGVHALLETIPAALTMRASQMRREEGVGGLPMKGPRVFMVGVIGPVRDRLQAGEVAHARSQHAAEGRGTRAWLWGRGARARLGANALDTGTRTIAGGTGAQSHRTPAASQQTTTARSAVLAHPASASIVLRQVDVSQAIDAVVALLEKEKADSSVPEADAREL